MKNFKKTVVITAAVLVTLTMLLFGCKKEDSITTTQNASTLSAKGTFNCSTTTADAASIQLINPLSPKSWFDLSFCFTPPQQNIPNPIIYTNGDTMNVSLQVFVNRVFMRTSWQTEKIDEIFYQQAIGAPYPVTKVSFPQKPALQNGTFTFPINFKFVKKGYYNPFINCCGTYTYDTVHFNYDAYDFGMHSASTNGYAYVRLVIKSDKPSAAKGSTTDLRNPDPTWIQVTSPILRPAKWTGFTFAGFSAGLPGTYSGQTFQIYDTTVAIKWHLHVGLRAASGGKWSPDVIDYRFFYINGNGQKFVKTIPNGGVQGDYDFIDTVKIDKWGYYNWMYDPSMGNGGVENLLYDWNGITPTIHSKATNGWLDDPLMTKYLRP